MLIRAFESWRQRKALIEGDGDAVRRYERQRLVKEYGRLIHEAAGTEGGIPPPLR
jgi:hypothetical protein